MATLIPIQNIKPNHYEQFYQTAKHGGLVPASRALGMDHSTLSSQMTDFEGILGVTLFDRRPFALTAEGEMLYQHLKPCFDGLPAVINKMREHAGIYMGVGAPSVVLRDYLDESIQEVREQFPKLHVALRDGDQASLEEKLRKREISVALAIFDTKAADDLCSLPLLQLPVALVVPAKSKWKTAEDVLNSLKVGTDCQAVRDERSACSVRNSFLLQPPKHATTQNFQTGLKQLGIKDISVTEADTTDVIENYVRKGRGIGVSLAVPGQEETKGIRILPLKTFAPVTFGFLWQGSPTPQVAAFIEAVKARIKLLQKD